MERRICSNKKLNNFENNLPIFQSFLDTSLRNYQLFIVSKIRKKFPNPQREPVHFHLMYTMNVNIRKLMQKLS